MLVLAPKLYFIPKREDKLDRDAFLPEACVSGVSLRCASASINVRWSSYVVLLKEKRSIKGVDPAVLFVADGNVEEFFVVVGQHQINGLLELIQIFLQHLTIFQTADELFQILHILSKRRNSKRIDMFNI